MAWIETKVYTYLSAVRLDTIMTLAYEALAAGQLDVIDVYTTDAKLSKYQLKNPLGRSRLFSQVRCASSL